MPGPFHAHPPQRRSRPPRLAYRACSYRHEYIERRADVRLKRCVAARDRLIRPFHRQTRALLRVRSTVLGAIAAPVDTAALVLASKNEMYRSRLLHARQQRLDQLVSLLSRRARPKARSDDMNRASIGATSFAGSIFWPFWRAKTSALATRSRCTAAGSSTVSLTGRSSSTAESFSLAIVVSFCRARARDRD